jgi:hypothetical protein
MKKFFVKIFGFVFILVGLFLPAFSFASSLMDYNYIYNASADPFYGNDWQAQTFSASQSYNLKTFSVKVWREGAEHDLNGYIENTTGGNPNGVVLCTDTTTPDTTSTWATFDCGSGIDLVKDQVYAFVFKYPGGSYGDWVYLEYQDSGDVFAGGNFKISHTLGGSWIDFLDADLAFETRGDIPETAGNILTIPPTGPASILSYGAQLFNDMSSLIWLAIGLPVGFFVINRVVGFSKHLKEYDKK